MRFQFDGNQSYQLNAINAVADLFQGQPRQTLSTIFNQLLGPRANQITLSDAQLLDNLRKVQQQNLSEDDYKAEQNKPLEQIKQKIFTSLGSQEVTFPNFSVEMETGTGKTYVYLRTALELYQRYGMSKFIIVVHSVAVREGVLKTLETTKTHLRGLYGNAPYGFKSYDAKNISIVRNFALSNQVEFLVMTIDSFNKEDNVIRQQRDQATTPIFLIQQTRPILLLDEPQNMESEGSKAALGSLNPLVALRYSATHKNAYNLVYRLTPFEAYRQGLVKHIEVASILKENDFNHVFLRLEEIRSTKKKIQAKIALHQRMADGHIKEKSYLFDPGDKLHEKAERPEYETFVITDIDATNETVTFQNGITIKRGMEHGNDQAAIFKEQIRYTVKEHMNKQAKLKGNGLKVLSLIFIDHVENYAGTPPKEGTIKAGSLYPGIIKKLFDDAFNEYKAQYPDFADKKPEEVRKAYFAEKKKKGEVELLDSSGKTTEDRDAYNLIMKEKERLLSFKEPGAFIFSHSALREGWDNPNVCQICTLNQTTSEIKKRQEIGRGMRLVVDQKGERVHDEALNVLTVVANESYESFVKQLQTEMEADFGTSGAAPAPTNARKKTTITRPSIHLLPDVFVELWKKIRERTRYQVTIDTELLIREVVAELDKRKIEPPKIVATKVAVVIDKKKDQLSEVVTAQGKLATIVSNNAPPNLVEMIEDLLGHVTPPIRLTRKTLALIFSGIKQKQAALDNPQNFTTQAAEVIREKALKQLVAGIQYEKDNTVYDMSLWAETEETSSTCLVDVPNSVYGKIITQSEPERKFVEGLKKNKNVKFIVKLPAWFKVPTPVGAYNPDWALVFDQTDAHGTVEETLHLIRETKSTLNPNKRHVDENNKIACGERHFTQALGLNFKVVTKIDELLP